MSESNNDKLILILFSYCIAIFYQIHKHLRFHLEALYVSGQVVHLDVILRLK